MGKRGESFYSLKYFLFLQCYKSQLFMGHSAAMNNRYGTRDHREKIRIFPISNLLTFDLAKSFLFTEKILGFRVYNFGHPKCSFICGFKSSIYSSFLSPFSRLTWNRLKFSGFINIFL